MTLKEAMAIVRSHGMKIKSIPECGEYVVNFAQRDTIGGRVWGGEATAYYATDLQDAVDTAISMNNERKHAWTLEPRK